MSDSIQFPSDWVVLPIGEVGQVKLGRQRSPRFTLGKCPKPYLRVVNIFEDKLDLRDVMEMDFTESEMRAYRLEHGDILLTEGDLGSAYNVGRSAVYRSEINNCCFTNTLIRFRKFNEDLPSEYFHYAFELLRRYGKFAETTAATTVYHLSSGRLKKVLVAVPSASQQSKIAQILTTVDNLIEKTEALIAKYQAIKQGMMHDLFTRGVDEHGHLRTPYEEAPELYKQSELGWIPKEWEARKLGEALRIAGGYLQTGPFGSQLHSYEYVAEGTPVVMPQDITDGRIFTDQIARITKTKADSMCRHRLRHNDVVFSRRGDLSRAAAITPKEDGWICGTGCFLLRCSPDRLDANWIARQYAMPHVQRQVDANAVGSTMPSLNNAVMERLLMFIPSPSEQSEIGRRVVALESVHENLHSELHKLSLTKNGLMQDLLTGKVRVNADKVQEKLANG